jgi:hypothetical protein
LTAAVAALTAASAVGIGALADVAPVAQASVARAAAPAGTAFTVTFVDELDNAVPETDATAAAPDPTVAPDPTAAESAPAPDAGVGPLTDAVLPQQTDLVCALSSVDLTTGVVTLLPATPSQEACAGDLAFAPDGTLYGLLGGDGQGGTITELVRFDTTSGAATVIGQIGTFLSFGGFNEAPLGGITFDRLGRLFVEVGASPQGAYDPQCQAAGSGFCLYRIPDPAQPAATTFVGHTVSEEFVSGLASSCDGTFLERTSDSIVGDVLISSLNLETGAPTDLGVVRPSYIMGLDFDPAGTFWGIHITAEDITLVHINPAGGDPIDTDVVDITPAPEDQFAPEALAIAPLQCVVSAPITFTG